MTTDQFVEYVRTHPATESLGQAIAAVMAVRQRARLVPAPARVPDPRRPRLVQR